MKDKPIAVIITLTAGLIACVCCIINKAGLLGTLITVFITLFVFMIIGLIVNSIVAKQDREAEERAKDLKAKEEEEKNNKLKEMSELSGEDETENV
ncbi:MAG: hypothetical protein IKH42_00630 [Lachnospiraceae bacterium]|nr:hypothetical protein [Lachnospiraceae bacterium]MBR3579635.1 hypothetical protein [Lachnospiraceae bacterium]